MPCQFIANQVAGQEDNIAIYGKNHWQLNTVSIELGARYDWLQQTSAKKSDIIDDEVSASLAIKIPLGQTVEAQLDVGSGFRFPTLSERYFNGRTPRGFIQGNGDLKAEASIGTQLAFLFELGSTLSVNSAFYHYDLDNYIERYRINDDLLSYRNLSSAKIYGFELGLKWQVNDLFEHHVSYQKQKGEDNQNQPIADLHPEQVSLTTLVAYQKLMVANSFKYQFKTDRVGDSEIERDSVLIWDIAVDYQLNDAQSIKLALNNLGDQSYYGSLDEDAALQPERTIRLSFDWHY